MKSYVLGFAFSANLKSVVLILKQRPHFQAGMFNGVGGEIRSDESAGSAMVRQFEHETGLKTCVEMWRPFHQMNGRHSFTREMMQIYCFAMRSDTMYRCKTQTDEKVFIMNFIDSLSAMIVPDLSTILPKAKMKFEAVEAY